MDANALDTARALIGGPLSAVPTPALTVEIATVRSNIAEMAPADGHDAGGPATPHEDPQEPRVRPDAARGRGDRADDRDRVGGVGDGRRRARPRSSSATRWSVRSRRPSWRGSPGWPRSPCSSRARTTSTSSASGGLRAGTRDRRAGRARRRAAPLRRAHRRGGGGAGQARRAHRRAAAARSVRLRGPLHARARSRAADREGARPRSPSCWSSSTSSTARGLSTEIVGAGGLGTWDITGANERITEIHAGSYIFMDAFHNRLVEGFDPALTVLSTVISRDGDVAVLDCGRKSIGLDRALPELVGVEGRDPRRARRALAARGAHLDVARRRRRGPGRRYGPGDAGLRADHGEPVRLLLRRRGRPGHRRARPCAGATAPTPPGWADEAARRTGRGGHRRGAAASGAGSPRCSRAEGARVAITDVDAAAAEQLADRAVARGGGEAIAIAADVTDAASMKALAARVLERWGRIDILAANAGVYPSAELPDDRRRVLRPRDGDQRQGRACTRSRPACRRCASAATGGSC